MRTRQTSIKKTIGLGLERNVVIAAGIMFLLGLGEELWKKFLPKYLEALGASVSAIGWFGTANDFFDAVYQYPGGWLADRLGRGRAFMLFIVLAAMGYAVYLFSAFWPVVFLGLAFAMAWQSMASPALFAIIGDTLPKQKRALGFTLQAILKRVPVIIAPVLGGVLIAQLGIVNGVRTGLTVTLLFAALALVLARAINVAIIASERESSVSSVWRSFHGALKRLLVSDIIIRLCEGMAGVFLVLYATNVIGVSLAQYGVLVAVQVTTSILVYLPAAKIADRIGRKPFVLATFFCFALFPLAHVLASSFAALFFVYVIGGLREIGEPARKAMIVDFAEPHLRGRTVGLYYLIRGLAITPAAVMGGWLWHFAPSATFIIAGAIGMLGTLVFAATVAERYAS
jgi:MFS family permease